jgi:hypothetical protein
MAELAASLTKRSQCEMKRVEDGAAVKIHSESYNEFWAPQESRVS